MPTTLYYANQYITTTLSVVGGIDASQTTGIVLQSVSGVDTTKPGIICLEWADPLGSNREWITYSSINSTTKTLQGVARGGEGDGGVGKVHANGVAVSFPISESHINNINEKLNGNDVIDNDLDLGSDKNIKENGSDPWRTITLMPGSLVPTTTSGCAASATVEAGTNDIDYAVLDFDTSSDERAFCNFAMPDSWDAGAVQFRYFWTAASGTASQTVVFELSGRSYANDDAIDQAVGTAVEVSDALIATGDVHISSWSGDVTLAGTPAAGEYVHVELMRDVSEDDLSADARLIALQIRYKQGTYSD